MSQEQSGPSRIRLARASETRSEQTEQDPFEIQSFLCEKENRLYTDYVRLYNPQDSKIRLKIIHTWKVTRAADGIAAALPLSIRERRLVHLAALFHDIGRFEQVRRYGTYFDARSVDHAALGAEILETHPFLEDLDEADRAMVIQAVRVHNRLAIPDEDTGFQRILDQIVRDADKIDIFRVAVEEDPADTSGLPLEALRGAAISPAVLRAVENGESVRREARQSPLDFWIAFLGFVFDLNFQPSFELVLKQGWWNRPLLSMLESGLIEDPATRQQTERLLDRTKEALESGAARRNSQSRG